MYVWIIACTDALTASALDFGQTAHIGLQKGAISLTVLTANIVQQHNEDIKRAIPGQVIRYVQEMNCIVCQTNYARSFSQYAILAQFQSLLIRDGAETAQGGGI